MNPKYNFYKKGIEKLFDVVDKDGHSMSFRLNAVQDRLLRELTGQDIILKARQQGISTLILAMFTLDFLTIENARLVLISHETQATQRLFDRVQYFLDSVKKNYPGDLPFNLSISSRHELKNKLNGSTFYIGTAGARAFGHGDTITALHLSELSRYDEPERLLTGVLQAVPKEGKIVIESTANGYNYFYKVWEKNADKPQPYHTHFVPWFETPEYSMPLPTNFEFAPEELEILNTYHLSKEQMYWRRWKIEQLNESLDEPNQFHEQFPSNPKEAFISSGNKVWSPSLISWYMLHTKSYLKRGELIGYNPPFLDENETGSLRIWEEPNEFHRYVIGVDVSEGKIVAEGDTESETDYSCAIVLDRMTWHQVAEWHGKVDPDVLGRKVDTLGHYYNDALIAVERNAMGLTPLTILRDLNYPNLYYREKFGLMANKRTAELGWVTDMITKDILINEATQILREKRIDIYDEEIVSEMMSYIRDSHGHARAEKSAHDDRVMALLIAVKMMGQAAADLRGNPISRSDAQEDVYYINGVSFDRKTNMPVNPEGNSVVDDGFGY